MNFNLMPASLEDRALIKIAIWLCAQGIRKDFMSSLYRLSSQKIFETVSQNVTMIPLPSLLKEKLLAIIEAVIVQKQAWILFHMRKYKFISKLPITLVWTAQGTIDYKRTAEILVKDETIEVENRYNLACNYCLEDDVFHLKGKFRHLADNTPGEHIKIFWSKYEKENKHHLPGKYEFSVYEYLFKFSAVIFENEVSVRYFYTKLTPENADNLKMQAAEYVAMMLRSTNIMFPGNQYNDILYFLLTTMNVEQRAKLSESYTYEVLRSLLVWPRQSLFLKVAKDKFNFLSKQDYHYLLLQIISFMVYKKNSYLREIFFKFWQESPETYKQYATDKGIGHWTATLNAV